MTAPRQLPKKRDVMLMLLQSGDVFVHLDPRAEHVVVPPHFRRQPQLILQIGLNMRIPIPDLVVDDAGLTCTLSFNRSPFWCKLPWSAVFALVSEDRRGMVWPNDVPPELAVQFASGEPAGAKPPGPQPAAVTPGSKKTQPGRGNAAADAPAKERSEAAAVGSSPPEPSAEHASDQAARQAGGASAPQAGTKKPRKKGSRQLPPYLRVIK